MLVLDECDSILSRGGSKDSDGTRMNVFNILLQEFEKVAKSKDDIFIVGATNWPSKIDPVMLARFRMKKHLQLPTDDVKVKLVCALLEEKEIGYENKDIEKIVSEELQGYSMREIHTFVQNITETIVIKVENADHFKIIQEDYGMLFQPCLCKEDVCGRKMKLKDIPLAALEYPPVQYEDLKKASKLQIPNNTPELILESQDFELGKKTQLDEPKLFPNEKNKDSIRPKRNFCYPLILILIAFIVVALIILYES